MKNKQENMQIEVGTLKKKIWYVGDWGHVRLGVRGVLSERGTF